MISYTLIEPIRDILMQLGCLQVCMIDFLVFCLLISVDLRHCQLNARLKNLSDYSTNYLPGIIFCPIITFINLKMIC